VKKKALQLFIVIFSVLLVSVAFYQPSRYYHNQFHKVSENTVKILGLNLIEEHREEFTSQTNEEMPLHSPLEAFEEEENRTVFKKHILSNSRTAPIQSAIKYFSFYKEPLTSNSNFSIPHAHTISPHLGVSVTKDIGVFLI